MEDKPFKTLDEQIEVLKSRNMKFRDEDNAKFVLINNSYYGIINSYKDLFCRKTFDDNEDYGDQFFEDMLLIYDFDKALSSILYKYIMMIETTFKTSLSYFISSELGSDQSVYLDKNKYTNGYKIKLGKFKNQYSIEKTFSEINHNINSNRIKSIQHYKSKHNNVPPWIIIPSLSLGVILEWFKLCRSPIKKNVASTFMYTDTETELKQELFHSAMKVVHLYRNVVAHGSRLCLHEIPQDKRLNERLIKQYRPLSRDLKFFYSNNRTYRIFALFIAICVLLSNRSTIKRNFISELDYLFSGLEHSNSELCSILKYRVYLSDNFIDLLKEI